MKILLLSLLIVLMSCEDQINQTKEVVRNTPAACEESPALGASPLSFSGITSVDNIGTKSADVSWKHQDGFYQYHIISIQGEEQKIIKTVEAPAEQVTITGLTPDTDYKFMVRAIDQSGLLEANLLTISFRTLAELSFNNTKSLTFNGSQFVNLGASSNFNMAGGKTVSLWFKPSEYTINHEVFVDRLFTFYFADTAKSGFSVGIKPDKLLLIYTNKRDIQKSIKVKVKDLNANWHHLVATYDNTQITLYLNGEEILQLQDTLKSFGSHEAKIGAFNYRYGFKGNIDEFAFWGAPFNAKEVSDLYNKGVPQDLSVAVKKERLMIWYRMGDSAADTSNQLEDMMGNHNGTPRDGDSFLFESKVP